MTRVRSVDLVMPTDEEAIGWLVQAMQQIQIPASQASNVLAVRMWLEELPERLTQGPPQSVDG